MRDKNKLKKMLALLSIGVVGLTPIATVVSCGGTTQKDNNNNDNGGNDNDNQNDVVEISTIKDKLQTLVDGKTTSWTVSDLQEQKLGDKTLTELGITVIEDGALSGTNTSTGTQHFTFKADGINYSGSQKIDHNYTETTFTKDDISVIEDDLKSLVESKTDSMWETTGDNAILNQTLGGSTEYKDKTLSELGIDVECSNSDAQASENGLTEYNFQFTVNNSSTYLIVGSTITLTQNVLSSDKSYYSIYLDADGNKAASDNIPEETTTILRLGTNEDGNKFVSIPDSVTTVTVGAHTGITSLENLFKDKSNLKYVDLTGLDTSQVTDMSDLFQNCSSLETINGLNGFVTATTDGIGYMFANCSSLTSIDTTNWDTSKVTSIKYMFCGCVNLETITGIETWDMSSLKWYANTFAVNYNANDDSQISTEPTKLTCPNLKGWTISSSFPSDFVTKTKFDELNGYDFNTLAPGKMVLSRYIDADGKEQECSGDIPDGAKEVLYLGTNEAGTKFVSIPDSVTKVTIGDHGDNITSLYFAFSGNSNLETVDFTGFDSSNVTNMMAAFQKCTSLKEIKGLENLNTSKLTDMQNLFCGCESLTSLDLSSFNTSNVTDISGIFAGCFMLTTIKGIEDWNMSSLTSYDSAFAVNYDIYNDEPIDGQKILLNCPDLSGWTVPDTFKQSDFISSTNFKNLIDYNDSKAPGAANS